MPYEACPLPTPPGRDEDEVIRRMLGARRIAIVGLSDDAMRPSFGVGQYLQSAGFEIVPVNPNHEQVLGVRCYKSLAEVPGPIDVVNVFRRSEFCPEVVRQTVQIGARGVWLQSGIRSAEAQRLAAAAGLDFIQDRCIMVEHLHHAR